MTPDPTRPDPLPDSPLSVLRLALLTPWKAQNELSRLLVLPRARLLFRLAGIPWGSAWRLYGLPIVQRHRASQMILGNSLELRSTWRSNPLGPTHPVILSTRRAGASLIIGKGFGMTGGSLCADQSITIGDHVIVGANTTIIDTDFHPLDPAARLSDPANGATAPIVIEDQVFIGMNCLVLKGVRIGVGSVIAAGSVVTHDIPPGVIAAGSPAKAVKANLKV